MFKDFVLSYLEGLRACYEELSVERLEDVMNILTAAYAEGRKILIFGNGGSASTASHMACDLGKGTSVPNQRRVRVVSLTDNMAAVSAWANDASYDVVFEEQLANLLDAGDVVIGISASGNSPNVLRAIEYAKRHGAITIGFAGFGGGKLKGMVDVDLTVSSRNYGQVEDLHLSLNHILSQYLKGGIQAKSSAGRDASS